MTWYERSLAIRPDYPEARRNRSFVWLLRGDYERGWPEHEWRLACRNHRILPVPRPRWYGEDVRGRTILLHGEQGLGDILQFVRFACPVKRRGARVIAACPDSMVRLVASCPGVDSVQDWYDPIPDCDFHAPLMSLPAILGTTLESLPGEHPYLSADAETVARWRPIVERSLASAYPGDDDREAGPGRPFTIGIAWQGNPRNRIDPWRSFPLVQLAHIAELPGVRLISLQKGAGIEQLAGLSGRFPVAVLPGCGPGEDDRRDFLDTAAIMSLVDLVIAPESADRAPGGEPRGQGLGPAGHGHRLAMAAGPRRQPVVSRHDPIPPGLGERLGARLPADGRPPRRRAGRLRPAGPSRPQVGVPPRGRPRIGPRRGAGRVRCGRSPRPWTS